jgi:regulatory protein
VAQAEVVRRFVGEQLAGRRRRARQLRQREDHRAAARGDAAAARTAALIHARKRGFGPFGPERPDRAQREKQIAAMLRAGHTLDNARQIVDAASVAEAEAWAAEAAEDQEW